jgi:methionyl-tRNA formyltransferase
LREPWLAVPPLGVLNLHTSLLPRYRGASPIQTAIACGERETGVSLMRLVRALDAGPVADVERVRIDPMDTALDVEAKLAAACVPLLARTLPSLRAGTLSLVEQDAAQATYCRKLAKDDGALDFTAPAETLAARVRGLFPWPSCGVEHDGLMLKLGLADAVVATKTGEPGEVMRADASGVCVQTGREWLRVLRLQRPGGKMLSAAEFLRGHPIAVGTRWPSRPMTPLDSTVPFPPRPRE